jgi:hypothetical protein
MNTKTNKTEIIIAIILKTIGYVIGSIAIIYLVYNDVMVDLYSFKRITLFQAWELFVLSNVFFKTMISFDDDKK